MEKAELSPEAHDYALDAFATWVPFEGSPQHLKEADTYSEELMRRQPNSWSVKGTRGSILVEKGEVMEGMEILQGVMENDPNPYDCAISACFLALGELKQSRLPEAEAWLDKARNLDAHCVPLERIQKLVGEAKQQNVASRS